MLLSQKEKTNLMPYRGNGHKEVIYVTPGGTDLSYRAVVGGHESGGQEFPYSWYQGFISCTFLDILRNFRVLPASSSHPWVLPTGHFEIEGHEVLFYANSNEEGQDYVDFPEKILAKDFATFVFAVAYMNPQGLPPTRPWFYHN